MDAFRAVRYEKGTKVIRLGAFVLSASRSVALWAAKDR